MPLFIDILDNKVLGREFKRGLKEGELKGELTVLRRLIEKRFGAMPGWWRNGWRADRRPSWQT